MLIVVTMLSLSTATKLCCQEKNGPTKKYVRHTGYPGGQRSLTANQLMAKHPTAMIEKAVKGMLPKNRLGSALFKNLYVYAGNEHDQEAQKPEQIDLKDLK